MKNLKELIKAILFIAGEGVECQDIMEKLELDKKTFNKALDELKQELCGDCGIHIVEYKNKIQLCSNPSYAEQISTVLNPRPVQPLSKHSFISAKHSSVLKVGTKSCIAIS